MNKKISIVLPTYNGELFLAKAIDSVLNQTYKNFELIIVDDCSTDSTSAIINSYIKKDARIKLIRNEVNKKLPASLNIGFSNATGDYYTWTSDDNEYYPEALEKMINFLENNPEYGMVYAKCKVIGTYEGDCWGVEATNPCNLLEFPTPGACFLYKASLAKKIGCYDTKAFYMEDHDYWLRIFLEAPIANINEILYMYRRHQNSLTIKSGDRASILRVKLGLKYFKSYQIKFPEYAKEIGDRWNLLNSIYNENNDNYQKYKVNINKKVLYKSLKTIYKVKQSNWIIKNILKLGFKHWFKAIDLFIKYNLTKWSNKK